MCARRISLKIAETPIESYDESIYFGRGSSDRWVVAAAKALVLDRVDVVARISENQPGTSW